VLGKWHPYRDIAEIQAFLEDLRTNRIAYEAVLNTYAA